MLNLAPILKLLFAYFSVRNKLIGIIIPALAPPVATDLCNRLAIESIAINDWSSVTKTKSKFEYKDWDDVNQERNDRNALDEPLLESKSSGAK